MGWISNLIHSAKTSLDIASYSEIGNRPVQEDSIGIYHKGDSVCCILCDGLGGHGMGDAASSLVVSSIGDQYMQSERAKGFLETAFPAAQEKLIREQNEQHAKEKMKTTATAFVTDGKTVYMGYIGDSRLYLFLRNGKIKRTMDHSIPQMLVLTHEIEEKEIRNHPDRSILLRVMGVDWEKPMYEMMAPVALAECEGILLCSDGFWELIEDEEMQDTMKNAASAQAWLDTMVKIVNLNGHDRSMDNNSAIAVLCKRERR